MPTEMPKWSPEAPSEAVSSVCRNQVVPERTNTKAAPANEFLPKAPTTAVEPEMATEAPKRSVEQPSEALTLPCWDQGVPQRTNTQAAPADELLTRAPTT